MAGKKKKNIPKNIPPSTPRKRPSASHARRTRGRKRRLRPGQPAAVSKLDNALRARFCKCLKIPGLPYAGACAKVGISESVFHDWMLRGEVEPDSYYGKFREAVEQARMEGLYNGHKEVARCDVKWLLERRFPEIYGTPKQKLEVTGQDGGPLKIDAGIQVIVESSSPNLTSTTLTVFVDERPSSPWFGLLGLLLDSQGYIFDASGKLLGVLRDLPNAEIEGRSEASTPAPTDVAPTRINQRDPLSARLGT